MVKTRFFVILDTSKPTGPGEGFKAYNGLPCEVVGGTPGAYTKAGFDLVVKLQCTPGELAMRLGLPLDQILAHFASGWDQYGAGPGLYTELDSACLVGPLWGDWENRNK